ncbi:MAG: hypothetical protein HZB30_08335 [Nitrospirae bacterium]|nr:hypothetical protein [Nitrospirota bacterium]
MLKKFFILFIILFLSDCGQVQRRLFTPSEIEIYCQKIFSNTDESDSLNRCIQQERDAKDRLSKMTIPPDIERRCRQLSASTGGSYQVMLTCVQKEMPAKRRGK